AVVDMNYRGSTGYGRRYHEKLYGQWGEVDVDDCVNAVLWLAGDNKVDPKRAAIRGGSAGGYTVLAALAFRRFFAAGASHYGIGDLEILVRDTHKFEARYLDQLIGPYPERKNLYKARSPLNSAHKLEAPVIFFQGLDDKVVPPNQAESMVNALKAKGVPVAYMSFEGEGHGFRKADTIERVLESELYFYGRIFGFLPADTLQSVEIMNLPER
ncbi:MAG: S9 family peptidase, partial [Gammaproteobacteria bacterium]